MGAGASNSLFLYNKGKTTETYTDRAHHENFLAVTSKPLSQTFGAAKVSEAEQACADAGLVNDRRTTSKISTTVSWMHWSWKMWTLPRAAREVRKCARETSPESRAISMRAGKVAPRGRPPSLLPRFLPRFSFSSFKPSQKKKTTKQQKQSIRNQRHQNNLPYIQTHNYIVNRILNIIIRFLQTRCMILLFIPNK